MNIKKVVTRNSNWLNATWLLMSIASMLVLFITRLNAVAIVLAGLTAISSLMIFIGLLKYKSVSLNLVLSPFIMIISIALFYIIWGVDDSFITRVLSNIFLALPILLVLYFMAFGVHRMLKLKHQVVVNTVLSFMLVLLSVVYILTMNLKSNPIVEDMSKGHDEYLNAIKVGDATKTPNILYIMTDDMGYGDISSYSDCNINTPNIDRIASSGVILDNFYASSPVCTPSRFSTLTGRYPARGYLDKVLFPTVKSFSPFNMGRHYNSFELRNNVDGILGDEITFAEILQKAGYNTGIFGKWHLGDYGQYLPNNQGFDYFYGSHVVNDMSPYEFYRNDEKVIDASSMNQADITRLLTDEIKGYITQNANEPFLAYYTTPWPHYPIHVSDSFKGQSASGNYGDCIEELDSGIGEILDLLEELDLYDNTIIVFTSDNGPGREGSTGGLRSRKNTVFEGGHKVPFIMSYPAMLEKGVRYQGKATNMDILPTVCDILGLSLPTDRIIDGSSMMGVLTNTDTSTFDYFYYMNKHKVYGVQHNSYKLFDRVRSENSAFIDQVYVNYLFNIDLDPDESYNLASHYPEKIDEYNGYIKAFRENLKSNRRGIIN